MCNECVTGDECVIGDECAVGVINLRWMCNKGVMRMY